MKKYIIGIDTGGSFTDGVLLDSYTKEIIAKIKSPTTKHDLSIGISNCIKGLNPKGIKDDIEFVCVSTTLATNSIVEGKRSKVGLLAMNRSEFQQKPDVDAFAHIDGEVDIYGIIKKPVNEKQVEKAIDEMKDDVEAIVVSGYLSVRNPENELAVKEIVRKRTDLPVICAHELSSELGYEERTVTAILNSHLLSVVADLIEKIEKVLKDAEIDAPLQIVKGNGTMMYLDEALSHPIETVMSGPAASAVGGMQLSGLRDGIVVDIGGTTTDIAIMRNGNVKVVESGATVGGWKTKVKAVDMCTFGLGGDSRLRYEYGKFSFGPIKAMPMSYACELYPYLADEICELNENKTIAGLNKWDALILNEDKLAGINLTKPESVVIEALKKGPRSALYVAEDMTTGMRTHTVDRLLNANALTLVSITPTDLLHASGELEIWKNDGAKKVISLMAEKMGMEFDELIYHLKERFIKQLAFAIVNGVLTLKNMDAGFNQDWLYQMLFEEEDILGLKSIFKYKIIGLGAPAEEWIVQAGRLLGAEVETPSGYEVANAIGAAAGKVMKIFEGVIEYDFDLFKYRIYTNYGKAIEETYEEALECIKNLFRSSSQYCKGWIETCEETKDYIMYEGEPFAYEIKVTMNITRRN